MLYHTFLSNLLHRLKVILIPFILFILVFLVSCPETPFSEEEKTFSFTGTVTDENSGLPIADATVQIYNGGVNRVLKSTETDQEGRYNMEYQGQTGYLDSSGYSQPNQLRAIAEGYSTRYKQINRTALFHTINFQLPPIN